MTDGYEAVKKLAVERPDLLPLVRVIHDMGDKAFNHGLDELVERGIIIRDDPERQVWEAQ